MVTASRRRRSRWVIAVGATVVAMGAVAVAIQVVLLRDRAREVPIEAALDRFHASTPVTTAPSPAVEPRRPTVAPSTAVDPVTPGSAGEDPPSIVLPRPGVYRYRTTGQESIDALGGATHDYPSESTITVTVDGCGVLLRWDVLQERRDEWRLCATSRGVELDRIGLQYHEFFGQATAEVVDCPAMVLVVPDEIGPAGSVAAVPPQRLDCTLDSDPWTVEWHIVGIDARVVDGEVVEAVQVRMVVDDDDEFDEHTAVDWYLDATGLPLEVVATKESRSPSPIGAVTYREDYSLRLISREPLG